MRVGVTGAGGFTGRYMVEALRERGHDPVSLDADLTDADAVRLQARETSPEAVIHLAGR